MFSNVRAAAAQCELCAGLGPPAAAPSSRPPRPTRVLQTRGHFSPTVAIVSRLWPPHPAPRSCCLPTAVGSRPAHRPQCGLHPPPPAPRCGAPTARAPTLLPARAGACLLHPEPRQRRNRFQINQQMSLFLQTNFRILCRILFKTLGSHFALLYYLLFQFHYIFS